MPRVWVPIIGTGRNFENGDGVEDIYRPDTAGVANGSAARKPGDPKYLGPTIIAETREGHKDRGHPILPLCSAWVADEDVAKVLEAHPQALSPDFRSQTVVETYRIKHDLRALEDKFRAVKAGVGAVLSSDQKSAMGEAVTILLERGFVTAAKALEIAQENGFADAQVSD